MTSFEHVIYWLIANSIGGVNRIKILDALFEKPQNANELSENLGIDYKTIRYHLNVLKKNNFIEVAGSGYGKTYFTSETLKDNKEYYDKIREEIIAK